MQSRLHEQFKGIFMNMRLLALRTGRKLSQTAIALSLNCSQRMYSHYERGEVDMPFSILV